MSANIDQPVRVIHLLTALNVGGLEMVVLDLARLMDPRQFESHVVCLQSKGAIAERLEVQGIPVHSLDCPGLPKARTLSRLTKLLRQLRPQILHTHNPTPHMFGSVAARMANVPVLVHTKHGRNYPDVRRAVWVTRVATLLSDCVVSVSGAAATIAREVERIPEHKLRIIRNGIDVKSFIPLNGSAPPGPRRAIHVARLHPIKDQVTLLRATRLVLDQAPDFGLDVVGDGPAQDDLQALAAELKLQDCVRFLGVRRDVNKLLPLASFFVLSSVTEGLSISILEAMAAGLPVVATDVGGNGEIVIPGENGRLVPARSPEQLARAMLDMHRHPDRARAMGQAARRSVESSFDLARVVGAYQDLYLSLLQSKGRACAG